MKTGKLGCLSLPQLVLTEKNPQVSEEVSTLLEQYRVSEADAGFLPGKTFAEDMAAIVDRSNGKLLGMVYANPW